MDIPRTGNLVLVMRFWCFCQSQVNHYRQDLTYFRPYLIERKVIESVHGTRYPMQCSNIYCRAQHSWFCCSQIPCIRSSQNVTPLSIICGPVFTYIFGGGIFFFNTNHPKTPPYVHALQNWRLLEVL